MRFVEVMVPKPLEEGLELGAVEVRLVEGIEGLGAELELEVFGEAELFMEAEVHDVDAGAADDVAAGVAEGTAAVGRKLNFGWVEPVVFVAAGGGSDRVADDVGAVVGSAGNLEGGGGTIGKVDGGAGGGEVDDSEPPAADSEIGYLVHVGTPLAAATE
ncbi:MAG: hypothetical protein FJW36_22325, partial [Acidobacteria bacterium]|nr:hypothetical protein [Acidobacteriota bacterium]